MKKRDFETYQKRLRDFEILPRFSETHVFRGTIRHPYLERTLVLKQRKTHRDIAQTGQLSRAFSNFTSSEKAFKQLTV